MATFSEGGPLLAAKNGPRGHFICQKCTRGAALAAKNDLGGHFLLGCMTVHTQGVSY